MNEGCEQLKEGVMRARQVASAMAVLVVLIVTSWGAFRQLGPS